MSRSSMDTRTDPARPGTDRLVTGVTLVTAAFGAVALVRPQALTREVPTAGQRYYSRMYAARALPLAAAIVVTQHRRPDPVLLLTAAAAQLGDVAIGLSRRAPEQVFPPLAGACLYAWRASTVPHDD